MLVACALGTAAASFLLPFAIETAAIWTFVFIWGALAYGIYTLALAELGARFAGAMLVAGNAAFALMWGFGGIAGPPAAGAAMDLLGPEGLPLVLGALCLALVVIRVLRR